MRMSKQTVNAIVADLTELALKTYALNPARVEEDANSEIRIHQGGYGDRQLFELVQNAADELRDEPYRGGRIEVILTDTHLYCANEGNPIAPEGADTILRMGVSRKRGGQIGRFGVGVKSVLSVCHTPQFFSTSGSFGFDADWSADLIRKAVAGGTGSRGRSPIDVTDTPVLRLARELDMVAERRQDQILDSLLNWASTVVRLPLIPGAAKNLAGNINRKAVRNTAHVDEFPSLFQLFSPHVGTIVLEDQRSLPAFRRTMRVSEMSPLTIVHTSTSGSKDAFDRYRVFSVEHTVPDEVRAHAGELHDRAILEVSWAVPDYRVDPTGDKQIRQVSTERGEFWAYFPTKYATTLSGVVNAAWKTNEDRQNLLEGAALNDELLDVTSQLVIDSLPELVVAEDPAAYLTLLPGRPRESESPNWACLYLTRNIWRLAAVSPSIPNQDGNLQRPADLKIPPVEVSFATLKLWAEYTDRPKDWVHHSVSSDRNRRGKLNHILEQVPGRGPESVVAWLEALAADGTPEASKAALGVLQQLIEHDLAGNPKAIDEAKSARIALTDKGRMVAPAPGNIFRRTTDDELRDDLVYLDDAITDDAAMAHTLDSLGIREADADGRFRSVLDQGFRNYTGNHWRRFWDLLRESGGASQYRAITDRVANPASDIKVRTVAGEYLPISSCMFPGPVVPGDGSRDANIAVDMKFHADDKSILRSLGLKDRPESGYLPVDGQTWFEEYRDAMYKQYCDSLSGTSRRVQKGTLELQGGAIAGPLHRFKSLSKEGRAAFISATPVEGLVVNWTRQVGKQANTRSQIVSPIRWLYQQHGYVDTSLGLMRVLDTVSPELAKYSDFLPVAKVSTEISQRLKLRSTVEDIHSTEWSRLLDRVRKSEDDDFIGPSYALLIRVAADLINQETEVRCRVGSKWAMRPDRDIAVAITQAEFNELVAQQQPAILVADEIDAPQAKVMVEEWGMLRYGDVIEKEVRAVPAGDPLPLADKLPAFNKRPGVQAIRIYSVQECSELDEVTRTPSGTTLKPLSGAVDGDTVLIPAGLSTLDQMATVDRQLDFELGRGKCEQLLRFHEQLLADVKRRDKIDKIAAEQSPPIKLGMMLDADQLRAGLPEGLIDSETHESGMEPDAQRIAELAYNAYDDAVLRKYTNEIRAVFPSSAPTKFDGTSKALRFVADLKFPESFAGARTTAPPQREEARGPVDFPALHPYQDEVARRFVDFLSEPLPSRAMLSLPTGAGKTRVAAEAVIRWIRENGVPDGPILWIAQTTELCEQAVQSWRFVWEHVGPVEDLVVDRLWSNNSSTPVTGRPHLVVATDAKLTVCLHTDEYEWLRNASLVIVDEAHVAVAPEYTKLLEHLGLSITRRQTRRNLVGLTATPFRNDENKTELLAKRFGNRRLDEGVLGDNPIGRLQELGILSHVEHLELGGANLELTKDELAELDKMGVTGVLPKSAERRLAADDSRNQMLIDHISGMPRDWPVLVFATSVDHAKVLAAKLSDKKIRSVAIDAGTPAADRRRFIEEFRNKKIRVITNYGVLSQGFDAPATRAVVIARPVYSANIYQQMIGRGLRGVKNGGKAECQILDVKDNIVNFRRKLAFGDFEYLWKRR
ncbi:DEAD/DEAH box helicase [Gordonia pseudamarae]|uniref:DEAD/DEAH box helicase n=2 Tax=Gordoniaceae TaxID=85026 RepID=A0ABX6IEF1_9ACTN|nr:DEAD/DEAH box helicase [Gordonia sp. (in: high G+C Gram-positive bacteria)]QHN24763.1 DEAD/DEAH box helicase [Gordonia pseudamarae]QHN33696.1 DEAD/DEAH box helicase [Gordonia pseudamarae]